jgi:hypothetical protein
MESGKGVIITDEDLGAFFADMRKGNNPGPYDLTEFQKKATIVAYEQKYNKEDVAKKLGINVKKMKSYYEEYKRGQK